MSKAQSTKAIPVAVIRKALTQLDALIAPELGGRSIGGMFYIPLESARAIVAATLEEPVEEEPREPEQPTVAGGSSAPASTGKAGERGHSV